MGYSGLKSWMDGDDAAGIAYSHADAMAKLLAEALKEKGNGVNPSGAVNIGLFNEQFILPIAKPLAWADDSYKRLHAVIFSARTFLEAEIRDTVGEVWEGDGGNKRMHLTAYRRMLKNLDKTLHILDHHVEQVAHRNEKRWAKHREKCK